MRHRRPSDRECPFLGRPKLDNAPMLRSTIATAPGVEVDGFGLANFAAQPAGSECPQLPQDGVQICPGQFLAYGRQIRRVG
jgi:hypothetical protein